MAIAKYLSYAKERARWWAYRHPLLRDDIMATAMFSLVRGLDRVIPEHPQGFISACIDNDIKKLLAANYLIQIPHNEISRLKAEGLGFESLPRAYSYDIKRDIRLLDTRVSKEAPSWVLIFVEEIKNLLQLDEREKKILRLKSDGYSNSEIGSMFDVTKQAIQLILRGIKGRYLTLIQKHPELLRPGETKSAEA